MKAQEFATHIQQVTRTRSHGRDEWRGECPSCRRPSLRFTDGKNGLIVGCSWAVSQLGRHGVMIDGCHPQVIAAALGWTLLDFLHPELRASAEPLSVDTVRRRRRRRASSRRVWYTNPGRSGQDSVPPEAS